jgi:uncharacterized protein (TIGR00730 family)
MRRICVYCGSSPGRRPAYAAAARAMGTALARRGLGLVYGGGNVGLMGLVADAALAAGGEVIGVIPEQLADLELAHQGLTELFVVPTMHERKALMARLADAFVALPGGYGTFEELLEALTWTQLGLHVKPCGVLDVEAYYGPLLAQLERATADGFLRTDHASILLADTDPDTLLERLAAARLPDVPKWLDRSGL